MIRFLGVVFVCYRLTHLYRIVVKRLRGRGLWTKWRYMKKMLGIPLLEHEKGVLVSWFWVRRLLASCFLVFGFLVLGFKDYWFLGFKVSKLQWLKILECFQNILVPFYQKNHVMFCGRCWSHIQDFQDCIRRIFGMFDPCLFEHVHFLISEILKLPQYHFPKKCLFFSWFVWGVLGPPKIKINGCGSRGQVRKSRNHRNEVFGLSYEQIEKL